MPPFQTRWLTSSSIHFMASPSVPQRHVLIVSHNFPPILGPDSVLMRMWALAIQRQGWRVTILTTTARHWNLRSDPCLLEGLPLDMEILRAPSPEAWLRKIPKLGALIFKLSAWCGLPDWHLGWQYTAMPVIRKWLRTNKPDIIYSRQPKHVSAVVAMQIKQLTGLPWVAHWSDMWASLPYRHRHTLAQWQHIDRLEADEMHAADALFFVAQRAADLTLARYGHDVHEKATLIRHGYETLPEDTPNVLRAGGSGALQMVHAGAFYPGISSPAGLFHALAQLHREHSLVGRFALHCVGPDTLEWKPLVERLGLTMIVTLQDMVPFKEAQARVADADLLLVVPYDSTAMPTKLFEYMAFHKPMLGLALADSDTADVMNHCRLPVVRPDDVPGIVEVIRALIQRWEAGTWGLSSASHEAIDTYHVDRQAAVVCELMARLVIQIQTAHSANTAA